MFPCPEPQRLEQPRPASLFYPTLALKFRAPAGKARILDLLPRLADGEALSARSVASRGFGSALPDARAQFPLAPARAAEDPDLLPRLADGEALSRSVAGRGRVRATRRSRSVSARARAGLEDPDLLSRLADGEAFVSARARSQVRIGSALPDARAQFPLAPRGLKILTCSLDSQTEKRCLLRSSQVRMRVPPATRRSRSVRSRPRGHEDPDLLSRLADGEALSARSVASQESGPRATPTLALSFRSRPRGPEDPDLLPRLADGEALSARSVASQDAVRATRRSRKCSATAGGLRPTRA